MHNENQIPADSGNGVEPFELEHLDTHRLELLDEVMLMYMLGMWLFRRRTSMG